MQARDCENRYIDDTINPYNLNHPTFGCSISVNMVQMVTDKREFTNPSLMDYPDANKMRQVMDALQYAGGFHPPKLDGNFQAIATQENISASDQSAAVAAVAARDSAMVPVFIPNVCLADLLHLGVEMHMRTSAGLKVHKKPFCSAVKHFYHSRVKVSGHE